MARLLAVPSSRLASRLMARPMSSRSEDEEGRRLYIGNLPWAMSADDVASTMESSGQITNAHLPRDADGRSRGFAFVTFASAEDANAACEEWDGRDMGGRQIKVRVASPRPPPKLEYD
jgi:RNA recognition motif-containing protein